MKLRKYMAFDLIASKAPTLCFYLTLIVVSPFRVYRAVATLFFGKNYPTSICLGIEAGRNGWGSIEFKELYRSAVEYFGEDGVIKISVDRSISYSSQLRKAVSERQFTHYFCDPRTFDDRPLVSILQAIYVALSFTRLGIVPIVYLTDFSLRRHRAIAATVSAVSGVVVAFASPKFIRPIFPHVRIIGPSLMPLSSNLVSYLYALRSRLFADNQTVNRVVFVGSIYEPRKTFLEGFCNSLEIDGFSVLVVGRKSGGPRVSDDDYWSLLCGSQIVISTSEQSNEILYDMDSQGIPQLVYRYLEAMAAGSLLLANPVHGITRYFRPGIDFVCYRTLEEATSAAKFYLSNPLEAERIRSNGHRRANELISSNMFWALIDSSLGADSICA
jgi:hypothetical protein